ncbi:pigment biosynthesis protein [Pseudozyma hubeiensis SY62]|uniref:Pigment biosynthesis protein n=1 Tax=Pseudozyma hubeiensis (strain SY62) TaxID=1305764 RepID=R9P870_PSEHS|nr:pigment biosynthesis protein [Pseudozyma hubeiensis SY62]GAC94275.1 pigment biosynthesis protein [Pseudozyma hubeiensis SY62]
MSSQADGTAEYGLRAAVTHEARLASADCAIPNCYVSLLKLSHNINKARDHEYPFVRTSGKGDRRRWNSDPILTILTHDPGSSLLRTRCSPATSM